MAICKKCNNIHYMLHYGLCPKCFREWEGHDNPEPDAVKVRASNSNAGKDPTNKRGLYVVQNREGLFYSTHKHKFGAFSDATVINWSKSAKELAENVRGKFEHLLSPAQQKGTE